MIIKINKLTKTFKGNRILNNISLSLESGNSYGLIGQNGSGKTMLLRAICGFLKADSGEVYVNEKLVGSKNYEFIKDAGLMIGEVSFYNYLSGFENLCLLAEINHKISESEILDALRLTGLFENKDKKYGKYSLGMKQRLRIAQAIMEKPNILILDEPFNGLDKRGVEEISNIIDSYLDNEKILVMTSHNEKDIQRLCNKVIEIDRGEIIDEKDI